MTSPADTKYLWILGHGGFLGSAVAREAHQHNYSVFPQSAIAWNSLADRLSDIRRIADQFADFSSVGSRTIIWAAGSEGVGTTRLQGTSELDAFRDFATAISEAKRLHGSTVSIVSSAGGVLGGSFHPPFDVNSPIRAINQYGRDKITVEELSREVLAANFRVHIARVTNLYGPWTGPRQGLINRLCTAAATREALQIYVSLDTVRDYIYVSDAARLLLLEIEATGSPSSIDLPSVSLVGSGENSSIGIVINTVSHVSRRKVPITMAQVEATQLQPRDLRMRPSWIEREIPFEPSTLAQGVKKLFDSLVTVPRWN